MLTAETAEDKEQRLSKQRTCERAQHVCQACSLNRSRADFIQQFNLVDFYVNCIN